MEINEQLFEDVLSGKLKGKFVFKNVHNIYGVALKPNHTCIQKPSTDGFYIIRIPSLLFNVVNTEGKSVYGCTSHKEDSENDPNYDIIDFIPDTNMKENELTIEIPKGKIVDWDESKKQNEIILKDNFNETKLSYGEVCRKLFGNQDHYHITHDGSIEVVEFYRCACELNATKDRHQLECILAKNRLATVAKYLNDGWKPIKGTHAYVITYSDNPDSKLIVGEYHYFGNGEYVILFRTQKSAQQAIEILGEETVKLALEPLGI